MAPIVGFQSYTRDHIIITIVTSRMEEVTFNFRKLIKILWKPKFFDTYNCS